jgi:hypothetical protein
MDGRVFNLQLDLEVRITDWPALSEACRTAGQGWATRDWEEELLENDPLVGVTDLALMVLAQGVPGVEVHVGEGGLGYSAARRDFGDRDPARWDFGETGPPWPAAEDVNDDDAR